MIEPIHTWMKGKIAVDDGDMFRIDSIVEIRDGGSGPDTLVLMSALKGGEIRQTLLSELRDLDLWRIYATQADAEAAIGGGEDDA